MAEAYAAEGMNRDVKPRRFLDDCGRGESSWRVVSMAEVTEYSIDFLL